MNANSNAPVSKAPATVPVVQATPLTAEESKLFRQCQAAATAHKPSSGVLRRLLTTPLLLY